MMYEWGKCIPDTERGSLVYAQQEVYGLLRQSQEQMDRVRKLEQYERVACIIFRDSGFGDPSQYNIDTEGATYRFTYALGDSQSTKQPLAKRWVSYKQVEDYLLVYGEDKEEREGTQEEKSLDV